MGQFLVQCGVVYCSVVSYVAVWYSMVQCFVLCVGVVQYGAVGFSANSPLNSVTFLGLVVPPHMASWGCRYDGALQVSRRGNPLGTHS